MSKSESKDMSLWEHLDELRGVLIRCLAAWIAASVVLFFFRDAIFTVLFAPSNDSFCLYRALCRLGELTGISGMCPPPVSVNFISTELTGQFLTHMKVAMYGGLLIAFPYIVLQLYSFVSPALYERERRLSVRLTVTACALFFAGVLVSYFLIFPLSFRFLAGYQVLPEVANTITLTSYVASFTVMSLLMGLLFEIPIVVRFLAATGLVSADVLRHYRKHALVVIMIFAAVITPTGDPFTLIIVTLPVYALYAVSVHIADKRADIFREGKTTTEDASTQTKSE